MGVAEAHFSLMNTHTHSHTHLIGAPLAWAGFSRTVMVVAVSFRDASDPSYSSRVGATETERGDVSTFSH